MEGVEIRHQTKCGKRQNKRCNCVPSHRAWISDKKNGGVIKGSWTQNKDQARSERRDFVAALKAGTLHVAVVEVPLLKDYALNVFIPGILDGSILAKGDERYKGGVARRYRGAFMTRLLPALGDKRLDEIRRTDLLALKKKMLADGYAAWTIHGTINPLRALLRYAVDDEILDPDFRDPATRLGIPKGARRKVVTEATGVKGEMVIRGPREIIEMIDVLAVDQRAMFATGALAGLRRGELRGLQVRHVDLKRNVIRVRFGWDDCDGQIALKSDSSERDVPILKALRPYLVAHLATLDPATPDDAPFFGVNRRGTIDPDKYMAHVREVWTAHGITWLQLHDARHSFASMMIASGANIKQISKIMGHSSITLTLDTYGHLLPGSEQEAADKMDAWLDDNINGSDHSE